MKNEKELKWLYRELPILIEQRILTEEDAVKIKNHYGPVPEKKGPGLVFIITGILGALLIGAGIILVFAHNWENLSRTWRAICSILPLLAAQGIYGYVFFKQRDSAAWVESSSAFLMMCIASSIALISQTYNMGGTFEDFILGCMLLSVPLMYLMNSSLVTVFYIAGISFWAMEVNDEKSHWYLALLAAAIPHLWMNIHPERTTIRGNILGWTISVSLFVISFRIIDDRWLGQALVYGHALMFVFLYLVGKIAYRRGTNLLARPFQTVAILVVVLYSIFFSFEWYTRMSYYQEETSRFAEIFIALLVLGIGGLSVYNVIKKNGINYFILAYPLLIYSCDLLGQGEYNAVPVMLFNVYVLAFGIFYIWWGIHSEQISFVNAGMFMVSALLTIRFFDEGIGFVVKGIGFIFIGVSFLVVNLVLSKRLKANHEKRAN